MVWYCRLCKSFPVCYDPHISLVVLQSGSHSLTFTGLCVCCSLQLDPHPLDFAHPHASFKFKPKYHMLVEAYPPESRAPVTLALHHCFYLVFITF